MDKSRKNFNDKSNDNFRHEANPNISNSNRKFSSHRDDTFKSTFLEQRGNVPYKNPSMSWKKPDSTNKNEKATIDKGNRETTLKYENQPQKSTANISNPESDNYDNHRKLSNNTSATKPTFQDQRSIASYKNPSLSWKNPNLNKSVQENQERVNPLPSAGAIPKIRKFDHVPEHLPNSKSFQFQQSSEPSVSTRGKNSIKNAPKESVENILQRLIKMGNDEVVFHLQSQKDNVKDLLENISKHTYLFPVFIELLFKVCSSQFYQNHVISLLRHLLKSNFPTVLINFLATGSILTSETVNWDTFFCHYLLIFKKFLGLFPSEASEIFGPAVLIAINLVEDLIQKKTIDPKLLKELQIVNAQRIKNLSRFDKPDQRSGQRKPDDWKHSMEPLNNFRLMSIVICYEDVHGREPPFLRPNITKGSFKDVEHYLDVQFRLLREDFVAPLRKGIVQYINLLTDNEATNIKLQDVKLYNDVKFARIDTIPLGGVMYTVSFDVSKLFYVNWDLTKRFINGTLVCLSCDGFQNFRLATIIRRNSTELSEGYVNLKALDENIWEISEKETFVMIESPTYFKTCYPILEGLKDTSEDTMPFVNNIVKVDEEISPPEYLNDDVCYDLKCIVAKKAAQNSCFPLEFSSWPSPADLNLVKAQYEALKAALTRKIAIIQGPPGTGKTFLGLKIVQVLLNNKQFWNDSPILIICCTNHALDQFLEKIMEFGPKAIVRVGGRSKSEKLSKFNMSTLKEKLVFYHRVPEVVRESRSAVLSEIHDIITDINKCRSEINQSFQTIFPQHSLQKFISPKHFAQLHSLGYSLGAWLGVPKSGQAENNSEITKQYVRKLTFELAKKDYMSEDEVSKIPNLKFIKMFNRWRLYRYWVVQFRTSRSGNLTELLKKYEMSCKKFDEVDLLFDKEILQSATIIGMTTNGAAKYRSTLQQVQPAIVVVEEAAEVLEAHIITALSKNCKHLILIGDHKQLRPNPKVYELTKHYELDVSLFERLIKNGLPYERLTTQFRMRPEIVSLIVPHIYDDLHNHPCVEKYDQIGGMRKNVYFLDHQYSETSFNDSNSKSNEFEASMIVALARYLLLQGYMPSQLTILSFYLGQIILMRRMMKNTIVENVNCTAVDNFQGEENDIILLSLVRSNDGEGFEGSIGFLKTENRVCVALSRAKKGFYCVGNFQLLCSQADIWTLVTTKLQEMDAIGPAFPLICQNHPKHATDANMPDVFDKVPEGGCLEPCEYRLKCGHKCEKVCHIIDKDHVEMKCLKTCSKVLCDEEHKCPKQCFETCGSCKADIEIMLDCGHLNTVPCYKKYLENVCTQMVAVEAPCGHLVTISCGAMKNKKALLKACKRPCGSVLSCEHICKGSCYECKQMRIHISCQEKCGRTLVCGHSCNVPCAETCPPCEQNCENRCIHSKCPKICGDPCEPCREPCAWQCPHKTCNKLCYEMCDREPCAEPCPAVLKCGHSCIGHCGEPCPTKCRVCDKDEVCEVFFGEEDEEDSKFVLIEDCNHVVESRGMDTWMNTDTDTGSEINMKSCPKCKTVIRKNLRYGNISKTILNDVISVKRKILKEHLNLKEETEKTKIAAAQAIPKIYMFRLAKYMISEQIRKTNFSLTDINLLNNKIIFLLKMSKIWQCKDRTSMFDIIEENLLDLEETLMSLILKSASASALKEFTEELKRVEFLRNVIVSVQRKTLNVKANICYQELHLILTNKQPFTTKQEEIVQDKIKELNRLQTGLGITDAERVGILKAIGLSKGHWFKCPNGHIYAIGECGGAMQKGKCPECGETIGGQHHHITGDNRLATEMDGAVRPAYPTF